MSEFTPPNWLRSYFVTGAFRVTVESPTRATLHLKRGANPEQVDEIVDYLLQKYKLVEEEIED